MYDHLSCLPGPQRNRAGYLTMVSESGLMFGIITIVGNFGTIIMDQSFWQNSVAAKPREGMWGFIVGGMVWFSIPFTFSTTMGFSYLILNDISSTELLNITQIRTGFVPPIVAQILMDYNGELLIIIVIILAVTSTATSEVMAVTSILIYDIYAIYIQPYRKTLDVNSCLLCGKMRGKMANPRDKCKCESMTFCESCLEDDTSRNFAKISMKPVYTCKVHGKYRIFLDHLKHMKNWCTVLVTIGIIPVTLLINILNINLNWLYNAAGILVGSAIVPVILTMFWARLTGNAVIAGSILGSVGSFISWISYASTFPNGLNSFYENTGRDDSMVLGNCISICTGAVVTVIWSYVQSRNLSQETMASTWEKTRDIDNPLSPWPETYAKELKLTVAHCLDKRPSLEDVQKAFKSESILATSVSLTITFILIVLWPGIMVAVNNLSLDGFKAWIYLMNIWVISAGIYIMVAPLLSEIIAIMTKMKKNKVMDELTQVGNHH